MSKTNTLRALIQSNLSNVATTYYRRAQDNAVYPHIVFSFSSTGKKDVMDRVMCEIDIYTRDESSYAIEEMADEVEKIFNNKNMPQVSILPTFYIDSRMEIEEPDKDTNRIEIRVEIQNYEIRIDEEDTYET